MVRIVVIRTPSAAVSMPLALLISTSVLCVVTAVNAPKSLHIDLCCKLGSMFSPPPQGRGRGEPTGHRDLQQGSTITLYYLARLSKLVQLVQGNCFCTWWTKWCNALGMMAYKQLNGKDGSCSSAMCLPLLPRALVCLGVHLPDCPTIFHLW